MKQLVCEMCEGTDFLKENGKFICQGCGLQYSLEEARKLMVEVGDSGAAVPAAAPAATNSQKVANLRKLAERAKEDGDSEMAAKYYEQLLMECPDDWQARFYSTYYAAHNIKIAQIGSAANRVSSIIGPTFQMIKDTTGEADHMLAYVDVTTAVINFSTMLFNNITGNLGSSADSARRNIENWAVPTITMLVILGDELRLKFTGEAADLLAQKIYDSAFNYSESTSTWCASAGELHRNIISRRNQLKAEIALRERRKKEEERRRQEEAQKQRNAAYWEAHAEQKKALVDEKKEMERKIVALSEEIRVRSQKNTQEISRLEAEKKKQLPSELEKQTQKDLIVKLTAERANLGLFKGKEKKAIDERLRTIEEPKLASLTAVATSERKEYDAKINAQIDALKRELTALRGDINQCESRIKSINNDLTRNR